MHSAKSVYSLLDIKSLLIFRAECVCWFRMILRIEELFSYEN
jgi:hypothetical protein